MVRCARRPHRVGPALCRNRPLAGLRDFDQNLELAARGLGAGRLAAVRTVTLPNLAPSVYSAAFLAFVTSFGELVVAIFIAGANMTLPKKMFDNILSEIEPTVAAVSANQIVLVSALLVLGTRLRRPATPTMVR
jgi:putative spermidine/putrescine transport system permease protein